MGKLMELLEAGERANGQTGERELGYWHRKKVTYRHEALMDMMLANPRMTYKELGKAFGYAPITIGILASSDAFKALTLNSGSPR